MRKRLAAHGTTARLTERLPPAVATRLRSAVIRRPRARWGNLRRAEPFSPRWGFDRGTPVDRFYIERFLARHAADVRGRVLEVKEDRYATRFGRELVGVEILDIDADNPRATIVADLTARGSLGAGAFDCFVLTQTLHLVGDPEVALENAVSALEPGGTLLVTVPAITPIDPAAPADDSWRWTAVGFRRLLERACSGAEVEVEAAGNLVAAVAFLQGLAAEELRPEELQRDDPRFALVVCARVSRPPP